MRAEDVKRGNKDIVTKPGVRRKRRISDRHLALVDAYFGPANLCKNEALRRVYPGTKKVDQIHKIFSHPDVVEEIERRQRRVREKYEVTYDRVLDEIARVAFFNMWDVAEVVNGELVVDGKTLAKADRDVVAALGQVTAVSVEKPDGSVVTRLKIKPHNKLSALDQLMRHGGLSKDKTSTALADLAERVMAGRRRVGREPEDDGGS